MGAKRRRVVVLCGILIGLCGALLLPGAAWAHATVVSTTPNADAIVNAAPGKVTVTFDEPVSPVAADTTVVAPDGSPATAGKATVDGDRLTYRLRDHLPKGTYLVSYRVISADGHPVPGGFTFSYGKTSPPPTAVAGATGTDPVVTTLVIADRYIGYAGLALVFGPALLLLAANPGSRRGAAKLVIAGLSTVAATSMVGLYLQVPYTAGSGLFDINGGDVGAVLASRFGGAAMVRLLLVLVAVPLLHPFLTGRSSGLPRGWLGLLGVALAATWSFSGHATTSPAPPLTVLSDTVHIAAVATWIGGLVTLALFALKRSRVAEAERLLPVWSQWATWLVAALAVAGLAQALINVGTVGALVSTTYGWLVIAKLGLFAVLLGTAALARTAVGRIGSGEVVARVRRLVVTELSVAACVLGVSAVLVQTIPAATVTGASAASQQRTDTDKTLGGDLFTLQFEIDPGRVGRDAAHVYLFKKDGVTPLRPKEWNGTYGLSSGGVNAVDMDLSVLAPNHASATVNLPKKGDWKFSFTIRTTKWDEDTVSTVVSIK